MENASKALIMAGGILIGVLILALVATLFIGSKDLYNSYGETKESEAIQQFNVNFTKYLGQELTIHQVVTICNFAKIANNKVQEVAIVGKDYSKDDIKGDIESYSNDENTIKKYKLTIKSYSNSGYINSISFE